MAPGSRGFATSTLYHGGAAVAACASGVQARGVANKLSKYARKSLSRQKEKLIEAHVVEDGIASASALVSAAAAAAADKRFGDAVTGIMRIPGPMPFPVFAVASIGGVAACVLAPRFPGREFVGGAAVGLGCEQLTLLVHRTTPRPDDGG